MDREEYDQEEGEVGTIQGVDYTPGSGIATLLIKPEDGGRRIRAIHCEWNQTMRVFSNFIEDLIEGGSVDTEKLRGVRIRYDVQGGLLSWVYPEEIE